MRSHIGVVSTREVNDESLSHQLCSLHVHTSPFHAQFWMHCFHFTMDYCFHLLWILPDLMSISMTEPTLWWGVVAHDHLKARSQVIYHCRNYFFKWNMTLHCQWQSCNKAHSVCMVVLLLDLAIIPDGIFYHYIYQQCYIFLIIWPREQSLLNCNLDCFRICYCFCLHSELAAFHVAYIWDIM